MRSRPVGDHAVLVLVEDAWEALAVRRRILDLVESARETPPAPVDVVPAACTVLLGGLPDSAAVDAWRIRLRDESPAAIAGARVSSGSRSVTLDVRYDGPDLAVAARAWNCSVDEVVARHQRAVFKVAFCGFAPGFAYCLPTEPLAEVPRRTEPRTRVPAGSVGLAGPYCGVYPAAMPGGWQLIGTTRAVLFDADRREPATLAPGDEVRFRETL